MNYTLTVEAGGFDQNLSYLLTAQTPDFNSLLIDPALPLKTFKALENDSVLLKWILITHHHSDHIAFLDEYVSKFPNAIVVKYPFSDDVSGKYQNKQDIQRRNQTFEVIHTPGHSSDSISFYFPTEKWLFTGDTVFVGRTGKVKSVDSSIEELYTSVYNKILNLPLDTTIMPGHHYGPKKAISIENLVKTYPFFQCRSLKEFEYQIKTLI